MIARPVEGPACAFEAVHQPRYRRDYLGELIQIDGSEHGGSRAAVRNAHCSLHEMSPAG